jgi:pantetheine-phosphate adenylyltransferase
VAASRGKNPIFSVDERIEIAREALADCANVRITSFSGLLVNFLREHDARVVLRGVRSVSDFDYEFQMAGMNRQMMADCETLFMVPTEGQMFVSGTLVREIAMMGGDVSRFVAPPVLAWIQRKLASSPGRAPAG